MKFSALSRTGFAVALSAVLASMMAPAQAETVDSIFAKVSPSVRDRMFFRLNYIYANVKTTSGEAYDVTGNVINKNDITTYLAPGNTSGTQQGAGKASANDGGTYESPYYRSCFASGVATPSTTYAQCRSSSGLNIYSPSNPTGLNTLLLDAINSDVALGYINEAAGLGTPAGIKAKSADSAATPALSVGYFLSDEYTWFVEAFVLAAPLKVTVQGDGVNGSGRPNGINGADIINAKLLPPTAILGRYFGGANDRIRPFVGIGGSYAMFFDVRATEALNRYQGGASSGDTTITIKNALGFGPFLGVRTALDDDWHLNFSVGKLRYKTEATLITRNTTIRSDDAVTADYGPNVANANTGGAESIDPKILAGQQALGMRAVTALMCDLAATKYKNDNCNLGTFERRQSTVLDNTMFMFSVGRRF